MPPVRRSGRSATCNGCRRRQETTPPRDPDGLLVIHPRIAEVFRTLDAHDVVWALLRGAEELDRPRGDVDLLVAPSDGARIDEVLASAGLSRVRAPGRGSHQFYFSYDELQDVWLKVDVVCRVELGPHQELRLPVVDGCLARRRLADGIWRLHPADEGWLLLLHLLLDKTAIPSERRDGARAWVGLLRTDDPIARTLQDFTGDSAPRRVLEVFSVALPDRDGLVRSELRSAWRRRDPVGVAHRQGASSLARRAPSLAGMPRVAPVVAILGPDGSGKSTVAQSLLDALPVPARTVYMGLWQPRPWDRVARAVPGARLGQVVLRLARAAATIQSHRLRGRLVVVDRFAYDTLLPGSTGSFGERVTTALTMRWTPAPDRVLLLDAPGEVMYARKGEHSPEKLEEWRQAYLAMVADLPVPVTVLDATRSVEEVRRAAVTAVWDTVAGRAAASRDQRPSSAPRAPRARPLGSWRRIDWRFLLPSPELDKVLCGGRHDPDLRAALEMVGAQVMDTRGEGGAEADVAVLVRPGRSDLEQAAAGVRPGGWVVAEVRAGPRAARGGQWGLPGWRRAFLAAGLVDVTAYWHAPNLVACSRILPLDVRPVVREALLRYHEERFGLLKSLAGRAALRLGLFGYLVPEGTVVGRRSQATVS